MEGLSSLWSGLSNIGSSISNGVGSLWNGLTSLGTDGSTALANGASAVPQVAGVAVETPFVESGIANATAEGVTKTSPSLWSALGSDAFKNVAGLGVAGYNALNTAGALKQQKNIQNAQLAMAKDAYNRNKLADEARQKLSF